MESDYAKRYRVISEKPYKDNMEFFFKNHGKCPVCASFMTPQDGCVNIDCEINADAINYRNYYSFFRYKRNIKKFKHDYAEYLQQMRDKGWATIQRNYQEKLKAQGYVDSTYKKSYSKNI